MIPFKFIDTFLFLLAAAVGSRLMISKFFHIIRVVNLVVFLAPKNVHVETVSVTSLGLTEEAVA